MAKIIGLRDSNFTGKDGTEVNGTNIYVTYPLEKGIGEGCERIFMTDKKICAGGYTPSIRDEVIVEYNRMGKVAALRLVADA